MKICVIGDSDQPAAEHHPAHGLGKMVLAQAAGLRDRGHEVTLISAPGSACDGVRVIASDDETQSYLRIPNDVDVVLDNTHQHIAQNHTEKPIINVSHDRQHPAGKNAVYPSEAHKCWHIQHKKAARTGRVIYNGVDAPHDVQPLPGKYFLFMSVLWPAKGLRAAWNAARLAGVRLVVAGPTTHINPIFGDMEYVGPVYGTYKWRLLAGAQALIFPSAIEAGPVTLLEAQSVGTPAIVMADGAAPEYVAPSARFVATDTESLAQIVGNFEHYAQAIIRKNVRGWARGERNVTVMIDNYERAIMDAIDGECW